MEEEVRLLAWTDGGGGSSTPDPEAYIGVLVVDEATGKVLCRHAQCIGRTTHNVAEYTALVRALEAAAEMGATEVMVYSDSELMVRQLNGQYKVKSDVIRPLYEQATALLKRFAKRDIRHVLREKNKDADAIVNRAMDCGHDVEEKPAQRRVCTAHQC